MHQALWLHRVVYTPSSEQHAKHRTRELLEVTSWSWPGPDWRCGQAAVTLRRRRRRSRDDWWSAAGCCDAARAASWLVTALHCLATQTRHVHHMVSLAGACTCAWTINNYGSIRLMCNSHSECGSETSASAALYAWCTHTELRHTNIAGVCAHTMKCTHAGLIAGKW